MRVDDKTGTLFIQLSDKRTWLAVQAGDGGRGEGPPPRGILAGVPGEPNFVSGNIDGQPPKGAVLLVAAVEPRYQRFEPVDAKVRSDRVWFPPREKQIVLREAGQFIALDGEVRLVVPAEGTAAELLRGLTAADLELVQDVAVDESIERLRGKTREVSVRKGDLFLVRSNEGWEVVSAGKLAGRPEPVLLAAVGQGKDQPVQLVRSEKGLPPDGLQVRGRALLLSDRANERARMEAQNTLRFLGQNSDNPRLIRAAAGLGQADVKTLTDLKRLQDALDRPRTIEATVAGGQLVLRNAAGKPLDVGQALDAARTGKALPPEWAELKGQVCEFDVSGLPPERLSRLQKAVTDLEPALGADAVVFRSGVEGAVERRRNLLAPERGLAVQADEGTLEKVPVVGDAALRVLDDDIVVGYSARLLHVEVAHFDAGGASLARLRPRIEAGAMRGKDVVLLICNKDLKTILEIRDLALKNGARSVTFAEGSLDVPAAVLAVRALQTNPKLLGGKTPALEMQAGYGEAARRLESCYKRGDAAATEKAIKEAFGEDCADLFRDRKDGPINPEKVEKTIKELQQNAPMLKQHLDRSDRRRDALAGIAPVSGGRLAA
jgi:hypothetical protein